MAGFLGLGNYAKEGPGVKKDEPEKKGFFLFFELYFRKFWKLCELSLLYSLFCIPFFIPSVLVVLFCSNQPILGLISMIPLAGIAIPTVGFTFILRNFARQEHAFLWMDFKDTIKSNWKQALIFGIIDFVVAYLAYISITFYNQQISVNQLFIIPFAITIFIAIVYAFMQFYIPVMIITFDLSLKQIFKNAFIFAFAGLGRNILISLVLGIILLLCYISPLACILLPVIGIATFGFVVLFNVWPLIKKFMIYEEPAEDDNVEEKSKVFDDDLKIKGVNRDNIDE